MKERGILFSGPMVRALLDGSKTQTRRLVTPQPEFAQVYSWKGRELYDGEARQWFWRQHDFGNGDGVNATPGAAMVQLCPLGMAGDRLWVRETWMELYEAGSDGSLTCLPPTGEDSRRALRRAKYRADGEKPEGFAANWHPAIFMPRWASRITLEITEVRLQRLQKISEKDALAEGISDVLFRPDDGLPLCHGYMVGKDDGKTPLQPSAVKAFAALWDAINGARASWASNPFVWAITFRRIDKTTGTSVPESRGPHGR